MYQMTLLELETDKAVPEPERGTSGTICFKCGLCGSYVGIYGPKEFHERGWIYKRDKCQNGHDIDWNEVETGMFVDTMLNDWRLP